MQKNKCGYIALLGCPNAGKSTLMNAFLETKIAVVSNKPQTTRNKILGICIEENTQILFLDTPGIHKASGLPTMNKIMNNVAWSVLRDADFVCYLIDITKGWTAEDTLWISAILEKYHKKAVLLATKSDKLKKEVYQENIIDISNKFKELVANFPKELSCQFIDEIPKVISAKRRDDMLTLREFFGRTITRGGLALQFGRLDR